MENRKTIFIVEISTIRDGETCHSVRTFPTMEAAKAWAGSVENEPRPTFVKKILKVTPAEDEVRIPGLSLFIKKPE